MTHNYYTLFNKNSPEIYRVLDKQPSAELYKNYYDALSSKVWKGINITKISFILEKMIKFNKSISYYITLIKKLDWKGDLSLKNNQNN